MQAENFFTNFLLSNRSHFLFERVTTFVSASLELSLCRSENLPWRRIHGVDAVIFQQSIPGKTRGKWVVRVRLSARCSAFGSNFNSVLQSTVWDFLGICSASESEDSSKGASRLGSDSLSRLLAAKDENIVAPSGRLRVFKYSGCRHLLTQEHSEFLWTLNFSQLGAHPSLLRWCGLI